MNFGKVLLKISKIITYFFHPVFLPFLLFLLLYFVAPLPLFFSFFTPKSFAAFLGVVFLYTIVFPLLFTFWLKKTKLISDFEISDGQERPKTYFMVSAFFISLTYFFYSKGGLLGPSSVILGVISAIILGLGFFSYFSKISAHTAAMAGIVGILAAIFIRFNENSLFIPILISISLTGLIASARLWLGAHSLKQIFWGWLWGITAGFSGIYFLLLK